MYRLQLRFFTSLALRSGWQGLTLTLLLLLPVGAWQLTAPVALAQPPTAQTITLAVTDGYDTKLGKRLSADGKVYTVQASDDDYWETDAGSFTAFQFQGGIPAQATIHAVRLAITHYEEKGITGNALRWDVGGGALQSPTVLASQRVKIRNGEKHEQRVEWDVTAWLNTPALVNDLKFVIRNENHKGKKTKLNQLFAVVVYTSADDPAAPHTATATQTATETPDPTATTTSTAVATATANDSPTLTPIPTTPATETPPATTPPTDEATATPTETPAPTDLVTPATPGSPSATVTPDTDLTPIATPSPTTTPATVNLSITKRAYLFQDADADEAVSPGDILFYEIRIVNHGAEAAPELRLVDRPDPNTSLIPGSVGVIGGEIVQGNGADEAQVVVTLHPLLAGASAAVSFRVRVTPAPGVTHLQNQAWVSVVDETGQPTGQAPFASDDPATASPRDPTTTPLGGPLLPPGAILFLPLIQT